MIRNYLLIALRGFWKQKGITFINLIGLAVGMSVCFLVIQMVHDQVSYDDFHENRNRIYRVTTIEKGESEIFEARASSTPLFKRQLQDRETGIEKLTCMSKYFRGEVRSEEKILEFQGFYADPDFFEVFGFELIDQDPKKVLSEPFGVVLSKEFAERVFPNSDPIGKMVSVNEDQEYIVRAIVKAPPGKTHLKFDMLASFSSLHSLVVQEKLNERVYKWENVNMAYNYMLLNENTRPEEIESKLDELAEANMDLKEDHPGYEFHLQSLNDITPGKIMANEVSFTLPMIFIGFFLLLGLIVILTATINYSNLAIAQALNRIKEVGIRKVNGATRVSIIIQFLVEAILVNLGAMILAMLFYRFLIGMFNGLWFFSLLELQFEDNGWAYIYFFWFSLILGMITGIGPALYVSRFDPSYSLKAGFSPKTGRVKRWYSFSGKKFMIGLQFFLAFILITTITLIRDQSNKLVNSQYGFDEENVFFVELQGHDAEVLRSEFSKNSQVLSSSLTSHHTAVGRTMETEIKKEKEDENIDFNFFSVDENYLDLMKIPLIAGQNINTSSSTGEQSNILINETGMRQLGFDDPEDCVGRMVYRNDTSLLKIVGVVQDYNYEILMRDIRPLMLLWDPDDVEFLYLKLQSAEVGKTYEGFEEVWKEYDPKRDFKAGFLDDEMDEFYAVFADLVKILSVIASLAIIITCLGLIGMVDFATKVRIKEVGVRKVLGAEHGNIVWILSREFLILILITVGVATPLALFINSLWLNLMANHIDFTFSNTVPGLALVLCISTIVILYKTVAASRSNPVMLLRSE